MGKPKRLKVVLVKPGEPPVLTEIDSGLKGFYAALGCRVVEMVHIDVEGHGIDVWCDEEGRLNGAEVNRFFPELGYPVVGAFFACGVDDEGDELDVPEGAIAALLKRWTL